MDNINNQKKYLIEKITYHNDIITIHLKDDDKLVISLDNFLNYNFKKGNVLDESIYQKLKNEEHSLIAYQKALNKLCKKDYSINKMCQFLLNFELNDGDITTIINKLKDIGLLNDEKYLLNRMTCYDSSDISYKSLCSKLVQEGIEEQLIAKYFLKDDDKELKKCQKLTEKYLKIYNKKPLKMQRKLILNKVLNEGFDYDIAIKVTNKLSIENKDQININIDFDKALKKYQNKYEGFILRNKILNNLYAKGYDQELIYSLINERGL